MIIFLGCPWKTLSHLAILSKLTMLKYKLLEIQYFVKATVLLSCNVSRHHSSHRIGHQVGKLQLHHVKTYNNPAPLHSIVTVHTVRSMLDALRHHDSPVRANPGVLVVMSIAIEFRFEHFRAKYTLV